MAQTGRVALNWRVLRVLWSHRPYMPTTESARKNMKRSGQWFVGPPPNWAIEDLTLVREVAGDLGAALLLGVYNVRLFADTPVDLRANLFCAQLAVQPGPNAPQEIRDAIDVLAGIVLSPRSTRDVDVARACRAVAEWAEAHSKPVTAVAYAEAAALLVPDDAEMANLAGRACRHAGERQRAELWYERGAGLARRVGDAEQHVNGLLGFGNLYRDHSQFSRAFVWVRRAGRAARRGGLRESAGEALHDAFFLSYLVDNLSRAATWAERAAKIYPVHAKRYPYFAADLALLLGRNGLHHEAIEIVRAVQAHLQAPVERVQLWAVAAWLGGGTGNRGLFFESLAQVRIITNELQQPSAAELAYCAAGAQHLGDWGLAEELIRESSARMDSPLAARLAARVRADIDQRQPGPDRPPPADPTCRRLLHLAGEVLYRTRRWRGPTWRPRKKA